MARSRDLMFAVRTRREELERTQLDVASGIGVSQAAMCAWENGQRIPTLERFVAVVAELGGHVTITFGEGHG